jgi:hypothetical protein
VNALDLTKIDIALLSGFAPNGEYLETDSAYFSIALQDYTLNTVNVIVAVYTESATYKQPTESSGITLPTCAEMAWRIRVYSEVNFALLPATDPNILNDAIDRCIIIGKVSANGIGIPITTSNIFSPTSFDALLYSDPMVFTTIPGVTVLSISSDTLPGIGLLQHYCAAGPLHFLRWGPYGMAPHPVAPPNVPPGFAWVPITADGSYSLPGSTGTFMTVQVILSMLPTVVGVVTNETPTIYNLYYQEIPRLTAEDNLHRSMIGTGIITPNNPHGNSISDLSGSDLGLLSEHIDLEHSNGFIKISSASAAQATISFPLTADQLSLVPLVGVDAYYCNGKRVASFAPTSFMFEPAVVPSSTSGTHLYEVYLSDEGVAAVHHKAMIDESGGPRTITGVWLVDMSASYPASAGLALNLTVGVATATFTFNAGEPVVVPFASASQVIRLYDYTSEGWLDLLVNTPAPPFGGGDAVLAPDGNLPGVGVYADSIVVYTSPDWTQNVQVASVVGWWDPLAGPARFAIGYKPYTPAARAVVDKRIWGTLAIDVMSDSALQALSYSENDELHESGVLYRRNTAYYDFAYYGAAGLTLNFRGGGYYCRGKRIDYVGSAQTLYDNEINLIYLDAGGTMRIIPVTADFAGSIPDAAAYVIGSTHLTPWVSSVYEATDATDSPERGVVLYSIVTAAGAISSYTNLMRNVNGPVYEWSVSSFTSSSALSAFDSLYTAFLYASLRSTRDYRIEIQLNGLSYIPSAITQPSNVDVIGKNSSSSAVNISVISATGAWQLSNNCTVRNVYISTTVDGAVAIGLASNCTVEGCVYTSTAATNDYFMVSAIDKNGVRLRNNKCSTRSCFVMTVGGSTTLYDWWVENNSITQSQNSVGTSLINVIGYDIHIKNNKIITNNAGTFTPAISGVFSGTTNGDFIIDGNIIEIGTGADTAPQYGIYFDTSGDGIPKIINNTVKRVSGSASHVGIGVFVIHGGAVIRGNTMSEMGISIWVASNAISSLQIEGNTINGGYHSGISVSALTGTWTTLSDVTIRGNSLSIFAKNAGGVALYGNDLQGIYLYGLIDDGISVGNIIVSDNTLTNFSSALGNIFGVCMESTFVLGGISSLDGLSLCGNTMRTFATLAGGTSVFGVRVAITAAGGAASFLDCRALSVSNNNIRGMLSADENAYGIYCNINLDSGHTTGLNGLAVNGNNVAGFWGDITDSTSVSAGIHIDGPSSFDDVMAVTCNSNNVASNSLMIAGAVVNDATFVYGIYNNLTNSVISNNNISFTGALTTVRGDGIRCFPKGTALPTLKSVISGNSIDVNWTGLHLKGDGVSCTFDVSGNRINTKSVGIYMDSNVVLSSVSSNVVCSTPSNACNYTGCILTGGGCIIGRTSWPLQTNIIGNNLTLNGSLGALSANVWLDVSDSVSVDNNRSYKTGAIVGTVYHIYLHDCYGATSISGNYLDNSVLLGAHGIYIDTASLALSNISALNNKIKASNDIGGAIYEFYCRLSGVGTLCRANVLGNTINIDSANHANTGLSSVILTGGPIVNVHCTTPFEFADTINFVAETYTTAPAYPKANVKSRNTGTTTADTEWW